jgi:hypothetical protein
MIYDDFVKWLDNLNLSTVDANPITFKLTDFESDKDFAASMVLAGRHLVNEEDIVVRYSKPYNEDKTDVIVRFQILRSKAKMFFNYLKNNDTKISCILCSNKDIKDAIKFFNSLGVKGEDMISLSSKEMDYVSILKEALDDYNKSKGEDNTCSLIISISIEHNDNTENDYPMLSYDFIEGNNFTNYDATKAWVKGEILKIKE